MIHTLHTDFMADKISKVQGIMNGTTNYMLCKMEDEGAEYNDALKEVTTSEWFLCFLFSFLLYVSTGINRSTSSVQQ